jgi:signal transduction histidine kinase
VGFAVSGVVLFALLGLALERTVDTAAGGTAADVAALAAANQLPDPVPVSAGQIVQVVDGQGRVRYASINADRLVSLLHPDELARARAGERLYIDGARVAVDGPLRVRARAVGDDTVVVARPVAEVYRTFGLLRTALLLVYPALVVLLAALAWRVVGAVLRPVEALRAGAESITGAAATHAADRLPVPASGDEIHRLAVTLNGMLDRLATVRARQRAFVADAAHELRSPLATMRTELEVAQRHGITVDLAADLLADVERLSRLVDDLLLLARADDAAAPPPVEPTPVDVACLLAEVAERCRNARVPVTAGSEGPLWTNGTSDALVRAVTNLVDNAVRHAASRVVLTGYAEAGDVVVEVVDDGPGIPAGERERVFDRFTRLDDARARDDGGSGLGLAIVRELVRRHGGRVALQDADPGVRAVVRLPRRA